MASVYQSKCIPTITEGVWQFGVSICTSVKVRSFPPVIFHTIPVALSIPISSRGDCMALSAASLARVLPENQSAGLAGVG